MDFEYISKLLQSILLAILPVLAGQGVAVLFAQYKAKRAELSERNQFLLDNFVRVAVFAAEQIYGSGKGAEKKAYVIGLAEKWLAQHKLNIDLDVLVAQIESAVKQELSNG